MTYTEAIQFLYGLQMFGMNFGLENTRRLATFAGNPQTQLRFIHVAGTNGKGSTCAMLESIYRAAGLRVGLFTSPHLVSFRERIQVNRQLIPEGELVRLVKEIRPMLEQFPADNHLTLFEVVTVMALKFFAEQKCELVIWETGLGGRLDATNIVTPLASVITNIAFDHQQWLGDTLEKIAAEKAGIIKPGIPVITATNESSALAVIERIAREKNAPLVEINSWEGRRVAVPNQSQFGSPARRPFQIENLPLPGEHQKLNAGLALATIEILQKQIPVSEEQIRAGLAGVNWPGRLQLIQTTAGQKILLDGAHNVAGADALSAALRSGAPASGPARFKIEPRQAGPEAGVRTKYTFIVGFLGDKDWRPMCEILVPLAAKILCVPVSSVRTADVNDLAKTFQSANPATKVVVCKNLAAALNASKDESFIVITGSLYLVGEALELLGLSPAGGGERRLNEWAGGAPPAYKLS
jgi:dihydrofolate synthase / folylpolyglutamate synthase